MATDSFCCPRRCCGVFRVHSQKLGDRLLLFSPVVFLLFAPRYAETLDWAMGGLQNLPVIFFALLCFHLLGRTHRGAFAGACLCGMGAVGSSGNGVLVWVVGFIFVLQRHSRLRWAVWAILSTCTLALYFHHLHSYSNPAPQTVYAALKALLFPVLFLGATAGHPASALLVGLCVLGVAGYLTQKGWRVGNPSTFYAAVWILATALGVATARHNLGPTGALVSRYRIYSQLSLALLYMAMLSLGLERRWPLAHARRAWSVFVVCCLSFNVVTYRTTVPFLAHRRILVRSHYVYWLLDPDHVSLVPD